MASKGKAKPGGLVIQAAVSGSGEVVSDVKKMTAAIDEMFPAAAEQTKNIDELGSAFSKLGGKTNAVLSKLAPLADGFGKLSTQVNGLGKGIGGVLSAFGPWGAAIGFVLDGATKLYDVLTQTSAATKETESRVADLAAAYLDLGEQATWAAARQRLADKAATDTAKDEINALNAKYDAQIKAVDAAQMELRLAQEALAASRMTHSQYQAAKDRLQVAKDHLAEVTRTKEQLEGQLTIAADVLQIDMQRVTEAKLLADEQRKQEEHAKQVLRDQEAAERKRQQEREAAAKAAADKARAEITALQQLRVQTDEVVWQAGEHDDDERYEHQRELAYRGVEAQIEDAYRVAEALDLIDAQIAANKAQREREAAEKRQEDLERWTTEAAQRASAMTAQPQAQTDTERQLEAISQKRDQLMQDAIKWQSLEGETLDQYRSDYEETLAALNVAEEQYSALSTQLADERAEARRKEAADGARDAIALTEAQKKAARATADAANTMGSALEQFGAGAGVVTAMQMTASGIQAACDAINYASEAAWNYAWGNIGTGAALTAAAIAKGAAAAAYAKGLVEIGASGFADPTGGGASSSAASASRPSASLTGLGDDSSTTEINVTMAFTGKAGALGRALIDDINAEADTPGGARISSRVVR